MQHIDGRLFPSMQVYGGIISTASSGQEREVSASEFADGHDAYERVVEFDGKQESGQAGK